MTNVRQPRRTPDQWQTIVDTFHTSKLTAPKFCLHEGINYPSFIKWKKRLSDDLSVDSSTPPFIELTQSPAPQERYQIEIDLGPGIQLRILR